MQVIRIENIPEFYLERTVFPGQRLIFEAPTTAVLEIHTATIATAILADKIHCQQLQHVVEQPTKPSLHQVRTAMDERLCA